MEKFQGSLCPIKTGGRRTSQEYLYILCEFVEHSFETIGSKRRRLSNKMYKYSRFRLTQQPLFIFDKFLFLDYNILNKTTGKDGCTPSAPGRYKSLVTKSSRYLDQRQGGYFLFFILRMATIKFAVAMTIINSSYVLIITTPFVRPPKQVEAALPSCLGKYTLLS